MLLFFFFFFSSFFSQQIYLISIKEQEKPNKHTKRKCKEKEWEQKHLTGQEKRSENLKKSHWERKREMVLSPVWFVAAGNAITSVGDTEWRLSVYCCYFVCVKISTEKKKTHQFDKIRYWAKINPSTDLHTYIHIYVHIFAKTIDAVQWKGWKNVKKAIENGLRSQINNFLSLYKCVCVCLFSLPPPLGI